MFGETKDVATTVSTGSMSDGYHTFDELYHHRAVLFSVICKNYRDICWKSTRHQDGTMYPGMFIVGINTPYGQATYHYDYNKYWDMFDVPEVCYAPEWDGHTPAEAIERIGGLASGDKLSRIMTKQLTLQNRLGYYFGTMSTAERVAYIKEYEQHMAHEAHEMLAELPYFKSWKKYTENPSVQRRMFNAAKAEWVDVLHFFVNISLALGFTAEELFGAFNGKQAINYERQQDTENYKKCVEEPNEN